MAMLKYTSLCLGELSTNCYLLWEEESKKCIILDPADDAVAISEEVRVRNLIIKGIVATHGHYDHLLAAYDLQLMYRVPFYANSKDYFLINRINHTARFFSKRNMDLAEKLKIQVDLLEVGEIKLGNSRLKIIPTPGHTPGSLSFYSEEDLLLFTGDTLFADGVGSTEHDYSDRKELVVSLGLLHKLPEGTEVLPGHGESFLL